MNQQTTSPQYLSVSKPVNVAPVEAVPLWFICPGCRSVLSVPIDRAGMEGPCPTCKTQIRAPRSEEAYPIHEHPPGFAARKKIEAQREMPPEEVRNDQEVEERRKRRLQTAWNRNAEVSKSRVRKGHRLQRFLDSAWPQAGAIAMFVASLIVAWRVLKG